MGHHMSTLGKVKGEYGLCLLLFTFTRCKHKTLNQRNKKHPADIKEICTICSMLQQLADTLQCSNMFVNRYIS